MQSNKTSLFTYLNNFYNKLHISLSFLSEYCGLFSMKSDGIKTSNIGCKCLPLGSIRIHILLLFFLPNSLKNH